MSTYNFEAVILESDIGSGGAYIEFPYNVEKEFGIKGRVKVVCDFEGVEYRGSLVKMGTDCHIIGITKEIRNKIGKHIGDKVLVKLAKDEEERKVELHPQLAALFQQDSAMEKVYEKLSYTKKKDIYQQLSTAKKAETLNSRLTKIAQDLKNNP